MSRLSVPAVALVLALGTLGTFATAQPPRPPRGLPPVRVPTGNPITQNKVLLGKALFFEEQLSATRTMACATCHTLESGGVDRRVNSSDSIHPGRDGRVGTPDDIRGSMGVIGNDALGNYRPTPAFGLDVQVTNRRSPSVINAAFAPMLFWDGRAGEIFVDPANGQTVLLNGQAALETQASAPPVSDVEMAHFGERWTDVANRIAYARPLQLASDIPATLASFVINKSYPDLFAAAFGTRDVTPARIAMAIATYERTLIADQSPFDAFNRGQNNALTASQQRGLQIFGNPNTACAQCHQGPLLTDNQFHNTGVRPVVEDPGRQLVTSNPADRGRFKTPSLRNAGLRSHFFHNGRMRTLADVVDFYNRGGDFNENKDRRIRPLGLGANQRADLVNFLNALTDPRVANRQPPFDRPTLYTESTRVPAQVGVGTAGSAALVPEMIAIEPPSLGNPSLTLGIRNGLGGAPALLGLATDTTASPVVIGGARIYLTLTNGLILLPRQLLGSGAGGGFQSIAFPVPNNPRLLGAHVGAQWVVADTGAGKTLSATAAARLIVF